MREENRSKRSTQKNIKGYQEQIAKLTLKLDSFSSLTRDYEDLCQFLQQLQASGEQQSQSTLKLISDNAIQSAENKRKSKETELRLLELSTLLEDRSRAVTQLVEEKKRLVADHEQEISRMRTQVTEAEAMAVVLQNRYEDAIEAESNAKSELSKLLKAHVSTSTVVDQHVEHFSTDACPACRRPWKQEFASDNIPSISESVTTNSNDAPNEMEAFELSCIEKGRFFEEFVKLKKENRSLKLQLSDLCKVSHLSKHSTSSPALPGVPPTVNQPSSGVNLGTISDATTVAVSKKKTAGGTNNARKSSKK